MACGESGGLWRHFAAETRLDSEPSSKNNKNTAKNNKMQRNAAEKQVEVEWKGLRVDIAHAVVFTAKQKHRHRMAMSALYK